MPSGPAVALASTLQSNVCFFICKSEFGENSSHVYRDKRVNFAVNKHSIALNGHRVYALMFGSSKFSYMERQMNHFKQQFLRSAMVQLFKSFQLTVLSSL